METAQPRKCPLDVTRVRLYPCRAFRSSPRGEERAKSEAILKLGSEARPVAKPEVKSEAKSNPILEGYNGQLLSTNRSDV